MRAKSLLFALSAVAMSAAADKPNIVIIHVDDMGPEEVACYGGNVLTPHIDSLALEGVRLSRYYASSAVCSPSRYNLLTGRYASRCADLMRQYPDTSEPSFIRWNTFLEGKERTIGHLFKGSGYRTALVGKHHNIRNENIDNELLKRDVPLQEEIPAGADPKSKSEAKRMLRNYERNQEEIRETMGFDEVINVYANNLHTLDIDESLQEHNPEWITEGGLEFIERNHDQPFFLYFALTTPHAPDNVESMKANPRISSKGYLEDIPDTGQPAREEVLRRVEEAGLSIVEAAPSAWLDDSVGALLGKLDEYGLKDNTFVAFISDHNGKGKLTCYEDGVRTIGLFRWPNKIPGGRVVNGMMGNVDFVPTLLNLAGIGQPEDYVVDGVDALPLLAGEVDRIRDSLFLEIAYTKGVVTENWKYIATRFPSHIRNEITPENRNLYNHEGQRATWDALSGVIPVRYGTDKNHPGIFSDDQLYNLAFDPGEKWNLTDDLRCDEKEKFMKKLLRDYTEGFPHRFGEF